MADFVQTMKDWRMMCQHMEKIVGDRSCDICPLGGCNAIYEDDGNTDYAEIEEKVAAWAAEHPEPVYPTWGEWLNSLHVVGVHAMQAPSQNVYYPIEGKMNTPIPADIARKLGIEPKEDT